MQQGAGESNQTISAMLEEKFLVFKEHRYSTLTTKRPEKRCKFNLSNFLNRWSATLMISDQFSEKTGVIFTAWENEIR